ncbi:MAG: ferrous iron transport protein A [Spirochaetales bacterium]|nr:ferrous iron transport protein A [Spirochaetales bacterium]
MTNFTSLTVGETAEVVGYDPTEKSYRRKLLSMGLTKGTSFTLTKVAPMGDPVEIEVRGFKLSLRKNEANVLQIRKVK